MNSAPRPGSDTDDVPFGKIRPAYFKQEPPFGPDGKRKESPTKNWRRRLPERFQEAVY